MLTAGMNEPFENPVLGTVAEVVAAFGGIEGMEATFGFTAPQVKMWLSRKAFSNPVKPRILVEARIRGLNIAPELVGLSPP